MKKNIQSQQSKRELANALMDYFVAHPEEEMSRADFYNEFKLRTHPSKKVLQDILDDLVLCEYITPTARGRYRLQTLQPLTEATFVKGSKVRDFDSPKAMVRIDRPNEEPEYIRVPERFVNNALEGDKVSIVITYNHRRGEKEAEIANIIQRAKDTFVGTLQIEKGFAFLETNDHYLPWDIFLPKAETDINCFGRPLQSGDKAIVKIVEWPSRANRSPVGKIVEVLGASGDNNVEMHAILAEFGLPYSYPDQLEKLANKISGHISERELAHRIDFRDVTTITIDPRDAKDFDDALSFREISDADITPLYEVGVHIADVTHFLKEGSPIDQEAYRRATSIYLVDRTIPMLPEHLCNYICSLRPNEDKLTYSVIFRINEHGEVLDSQIARTVIRSNRRFTYEEVQPILKGADGDYARELRILDSIAKQLRAERLKNGAIEFQREEVRFEIDEKGHPIGTYVAVQDDSHQLIEEFMLLANRTVAERIGRVPKGTKAKTFPYRIHDVPDPEKLQKLSSFAARFGYKVKTEGSRTDIARSLNTMLHKVSSAKEHKAVEDLALRTMSKARYSTHNIGHYGLSLRFYTHFTSPIRRYPDQMVHRLLTRYLDQEGRSVNQLKCEEQCEHSSEMEQLAANAERASIKYKQVEYMADKLGQEFAGTVSGVTDFGIFVELNDSHCEGVVPIRSLQDDLYNYDDSIMGVIGRHSRRRIVLGDPVRIKVTSANLERRQLDFKLLEANGEELY